jgi:putative tryptophan/tyrosine transport system substrate-binding protein
MRRLRALVPTAVAMGFVVNLNNPGELQETRDVEAAARVLGLRLHVLNATTEAHIDDAFATIVQQQIGALFVAADPLFFNHRDKVVALAARHRTPTIYPYREQVEAGGLISYGPSRSEAYRQAGNYVARILKGETPDTLPVMLPTKFELVLNLKTAKALGLDWPAKVLALADEVIE